MILGFTGTREGMTVAQRLAVASYIRSLTPTAYVHGGCQGADFDFHRLASEEIANAKFIAQYRDCEPATISVHPSTRHDTWPLEVRKYDDRLLWTPGKPIPSREEVARALRGAWLWYGATTVAEPDDPLRRNITMVRLVGASQGVFIATPKGTTEETRSGTWHCIRRTRKFGVPCFIVWPDGRMERT